MVMEWPHDCAAILFSFDNSCGAQRQDLFEILHPRLEITFRERTKASILAHGEGVRPYGLCFSVFLMFCTEVRQTDGRDSSLLFNMTAP
jgi:hypothetical protein